MRVRARIFPDEVSPDIGRGIVTKFRFRMQIPRTLHPKTEVPSAEPSRRLKIPKWFHERDRERERETESHFDGIPRVRARTSVPRRRASCSRMGAGWFSPLSESSMQAATRPPTASRERTACLHTASSHNALPPRGSSNKQLVGLSAFLLLHTRSRESASSSPPPPPIFLPSIVVVVDRVLHSPREETCRAC